jgi:hypothetical protein
MKKTINTGFGLGGLVLAALLLGGANGVQAHCDIRAQMTYAQRRV